MSIFRLNNSEYLPPRIEPVEKGAIRPFWSVMIPNYNSTYLQRTLESVLSEKIVPDEMQIEVVDDCSTMYDPEKVVREVGTDRVRFFRQRQNVGIVRNFNTCVRRARGHWIHILHSDDMVLSGFYTAYGRLAEREQVCMICGRSMFVDENDEWISLSHALENDGVWKDARWMLARGNYLQTPSVIVKRDAYEASGGFDERIPHCADWEMWARLANTGTVGYISRPYSLYRVHGGTDTSRLTKNAENIRLALKTASTIRARLPIDLRRLLLPIRTRRNLGLLAFSQSKDWYKQGNVEAALSNAWLAAKLTGSVAISAWALKLRIEYLFRSITGNT